MTVIAALGAIHVGTAQIGMVLAALGVGLGFGLQEIVSNFVCGIILLLERPIRIGDIVTVAGTTGKVDRINIRATTIINGDNQSMIVPNREFITGNLVNWTHKDKILRVAIRVGAAYGSDPEQIVDLLLAIAQDDPDVLRNPLPSALLEELGDSALKFVLYAFVPDPSHVGRVKHRLSAEVQRRFAEAEHRHPLPDSRGPSLPRSRRPHPRPRAAPREPGLRKPPIRPRPPRHLRLTTSPTPSCRLPGTSPSSRATREFTGRWMISDPMAPVVADPSLGRGSVGDGWSEWLVVLAGVEDLAEPAQQAAGFGGGVGDGVVGLGASSITLLTKTAKTSGRPEAVSR